MTPLLITALSAPVGCKREVEPGTTYAQRTDHDLHAFAVFIRGYSEDPGLPKGDIKALEAWIDGLCKDHIVKEELEMLLGDILKTSNAGHTHFIDHWGHPIVYRYPSVSPKYVFRLYSVGPNGIDEDGRGDDIDASSPK
jgi:hypothetical protein